MEEQSKQTEGERPRDRERQTERESQLRLCGGSEVGYVSYILSLG